MTVESSAAPVGSYVKFHRQSLSDENCRVAPRHLETAYHPVVSSMVRSNTMQDYHQVKDMYAQCTSLGQFQESFLCRTAERYYDMCLQDQRHP